MSIMKNKKVKNGTMSFSVNIEYFDSADELVSVSKTRKNTSERFHDYSRERVGRDWHGVDSFAEALEYMRTGYQPTVEKLSVALKGSKMGTEKRISFFNDISGFMPVVPLALKNVPNCMVNSRMKAIKCKVIDVYYDMTCNAGITTQQIIENGQKVLGAIIDLEKQGYRFNLYAVQSYTDSTSADVVCIKVKSSDKPLDIKRISFPLTHPAFFRVIGFDWYGKFPMGKYRSGYGQALSYNISDKKAFAKQMFGDNAIYILGQDICRKSEEHIKEALQNDKGENTQR